MNASLSVLLPVRNAQATLLGNVQHVIDVLPELTSRFEILIIDDGSTDATCEVAYELARDYPQVQVIRHATPLGWAAAVTKPAMTASGEFLMIHCGGNVEPDDIAGLWRLRQGVAAAAIAKAKAAEAGKLWRVDGQAAAGDAKGVENDQQVTLLGGLGIHARAPRSNLLLVHRQQLGQLERSLAAVAASPWPAAPRTMQKSPRAQVNRPTIISRLKSLALGE